MSLSIIAFFPWNRSPSNERHEASICMEKKVKAQWLNGSYYTVYIGACGQSGMFRRYIWWVYNVRSRSSVWFFFIWFFYLFTYHTCWYILHMYQPQCSILGPQLHKDTALPFLLAVNSDILLFFLLISPLWRATPIRYWALTTRSSSLIHHPRPQQVLPPGPVASSTRPRSQQVQPPASGPGRQPLINYHKARAPAPSCFLFHYAELFMKVKKPPKNKEKIDKDKRALDFMLEELFTVSKQQKMVMTW